MSAKRAILFFATLAIGTTGWTAGNTDLVKNDVGASTRDTPTEIAEPPATAKPPVSSEMPKKARLDIGKRRIEGATERLLVERAHSLPQPVAEARPVAPAFGNPKVEPGKVRWHADFDAACAASRETHKPVLLFQMMGNLDDRFC